MGVHSGGALVKSEHGGADAKTERSQPGVAGESANPTLEASENFCARTSVRLIRLCMPCFLCTNAPVPLGVLMPRVRRLPSACALPCWGLAPDVYCMLRP